MLRQPQPQWAPVEGVLLVKDSLEADGSFLLSCILRDAQSCRHGVSQSFQLGSRASHVRHRTTPDNRAILQPDSYTYRHTGQYAQLWFCKPCSSMLR